MENTNTISERDNKTIKTGALEIKIKYIYIFFFKFTQLYHSSDTSIKRSRDMAQGIIRILQITQFFQSCTFSDNQKREHVQNWLDIEHNIKK